MDKSWNLVEYNEIELELVGDVLPGNGIETIWAEWKFKDESVHIARFKYDIIDHFYPRTTSDGYRLREEDIVAWRPLL